MIKPEDEVGTYPISVLIEVIEMGYIDLGPNTDVEKFVRSLVVEKK